MRCTIWITVAATVLALTFSPALACPDCGGKKKAGLVQGDFKLLGNGTVRSWVRLDEEGNPLAVGVTMTETALEGLAEVTPEDPHDEEYELDMPAEAAAVGIDHIGLNWNPEGHIPLGIYDTPHFDVHFYLISRARRDEIVKNEEDLSAFQLHPDQSFVPEGYIYAPEGEEPRMGAHWVDPTSPEFNGESFTRTFIYGSYDGRIIFVEPMVTRALLASRQNVSFPIKQPAAVQTEGYYPAAWTVSYDEARREVTISLDGLRHRTPDVAVEASSDAGEATDAAVEDAAASAGGT